MSPSHPLRPSVVGVVALGGAVGAVVRAAVSTGFPNPLSGFPWTVFVINVTGSLVLALLPGFAVVRRRPLLPPLLGTGLCGGYTTMSTFSDQTRALVAGGHAALAGAYVVGSVAAGLLVVTLGERFQSPAAHRQFEDEEGDR